MAPDLNSLPPSRSIPTTTSPLPRSSADAAALRGQSASPSPRSAATSLQAAAAVNAGLQHEDSRHSTVSSLTRTRQSSQVAGRRRSGVLMNLQLNDPTMPPPGEVVSESHSSLHRTTSPWSNTGSPIISGTDPHHFRTPSLGEIHQSIEEEQESQVNRLLHMIRTQQQQLQQLQAASGQGHAPPPAIDESTPTSERSMSFSSQLPPRSSTSTPRSPSAALHPRTSFDFARSDLQHRQSRTPSRTASPRLRSTSVSNETGEAWALGGRDESAFYQAETQMMVRENQMLRQRIRELERQVSEPHSNSLMTHEPIVPSHLTESESLSEEVPMDQHNAATEATERVMVEPSPSFPPGHSLSALSAETKE